VGAITRSSLADELLSIPFTLSHGVEMLQFRASDCLDVVARSFVTRHSLQYGAGCDSSTCVVELLVASMREHVETLHLGNQQAALGFCTTESLDAVPQPDASKLVPEHASEHALVRAVAAAWCNGAGNESGMYGKDVIKITVSGSQQRGADLTPQQHAGCAKDFEAVVDDIMRMNDHVGGHGAMLALDFFSSLGLDEVGGDEMPADGEDTAARSEELLSRMSTTSDTVTCDAISCTVQDVCFDGQSWLFHPRVATIWREITEPLRAANFVGHVMLPQRYRKFNAGAPLRLKRLLSSRPQVFAAADVVLFHAAMAHVAEAMFRSFGESFDKHKPTIVAFPGVGRFNCEWCVALGDALENSTESKLRFVWEERGFRRSRGMCFEQLRFVLAGVSRHDKREVDWFGAAGARAADALREQMLRVVLGTHGQFAAADSDTSVLLVERASSSRALVNGPEVRDALNNSLALKSVALSRIRTFDNRDSDDTAPTFRSQVAALAHARGLVTPHGAALLNAVFLPPGALVVELAPAGMCSGWGPGQRWVPYYAELARFARLRHVLLHAPTRPNITRWNATPGCSMSLAMPAVGDDGCCLTMPAVSAESQFACQECSVRSAVEVDVRALERVIDGSI